MWKEMQGAKPNKPISQTPPEQHSVQSRPVPQRDTTDSVKTTDTSSTTITTIKSDTPEKTPASVNTPTSPPNPTVPVTALLNSPQTHTEPTSSPTPSSEKPIPKDSTPKPSPNPNPSSTPVTITEVYEYAGEEVRVTKTIPTSTKPSSTTKSSTTLSTTRSTLHQAEPKLLPQKRGNSGLQSILKPQKKQMSTLQKSKLDWEQYQKKQGISDQLAQRRKSGSGYIDKTNFLHTTELRVYEREREEILKNTKRS
ncbi:craniofacial development protein 1 [Pelomyxa schiedti]|nr:craniofacial development protein 1 [Pelomyxa schiedti]